MANLIEYHIPEAIQIRVIKYDPNSGMDNIKNSVNNQHNYPHNNNNNNNNYNNNTNPHSHQHVGSGGGDSINNNKFCNFCVDPQLTSFAVLQSFVVRGFSLEGDFSLFYLDRLTGKNVRIQNDNDLQKAFLRSGHPYLEIMLYEIDYKTELSNSTELTMSVAGDGGQWQQFGKNLNRYKNILSEWDVVTSSDIILAQTLSKTNTFICQQIEKLKEKTKHLNKSSMANNSWYLAETIYQYIISTGDDPNVDPLCDHDFRSFQDSDGRILSFRDLRIAVYRRGVDHSLRKVIWKHLLNVYPENYTGQERLDFIRMRSESYRQMKELWSINRDNDFEVNKICQMIRKDVFRTDRTHPFFACSKTLDDQDGEENPNVTKLFNILVTYSLNHKHRYCQGMSDLAAPLLYVMKDEAQAYITFCALMNRAGENFALDGQGMATKFQKLTMLLKHYDSEFYSYLVEQQAEELIFCYRWLLLDLKREFPFEDALRMLEVLWASIPPNTCAYQNLFDEGFVYVPNYVPASEDKKTMNDGRSYHSRNDDHCLKPNVNVNILESPVSDDDLSIKPHFVHPKAWNSPNRRRPTNVLDLEKPALELYFCCSEDLNNTDTESLANSEKKTEHIGNNKTLSLTSKTTKSDDGISSCSTFDSGIQRSNTLSDESVKSLKINDGTRKHHEPSTKSAFLTAVHCNGDFSDDDEHISGINLEVIDECFVADEDLLRKMIQDDKQNKSGTAEQLQHHHRRPMIGRLLTVGQSFDYDSSTANPLTDSIETILHQESDAYACESMLSKSISEEVLNRFEFRNGDTDSHKNREDNDDDDDDDDDEEPEADGYRTEKDKLNINSGDDLDCLSSSSTSSLVILNKSCKLNESRASTPQISLLSPSQLGSNDAFMLFICLTILLQNRDKIMASRMDSNDIQLYFDNMIRKHDVKSVLNDARNLFHTYLSQWHKECIS